MCVCVRACARVRSCVLCARAQDDKVEMHFKKLTGTKTKERKKKVKEKREREKEKKKKLTPGYSRGRAIESGQMPRSPHKRSSLRSMPGLMRGVLKHVW